MDAKKVCDANGIELNKGDMVQARICGSSGTYRIDKIQPNSKERQLILVPGGWFKMGDEVTRIVKPALQEA